ncbi:MAG: hypothetical protein AUK51_17070 [Comamonadaceae bacterium CG2_30_59_20]|nr:MAG: hypothetical protein AUK51_17070 [Comamonadaceae bacterium CG2_30_59_20]
MNKSQLNFRPLSWLMAPVLSVALVACGGGGQDTILGSGGIAPVVVVPPTVTNVTPLRNATGVATNTKTITATFSQAMDSDTLTQNSFTLACPAATAITGGSVSYQASNQTATLTLPAGTVLTSNALCVATVKTAAKDSAGIALVNDFIWQFRTSTLTDTTAPTVTNTVNANGATSVAVNTKVGATFSEAMNPLSITNTSFTLKQTVSGAAVAGDTSYSGVSAVFAPTNALLANTQYTAMITTVAADLADNPMASNYSWSWKTALAADTTAPRVNDTINADGATNVALNTRVGVTFSEALNPLSVTNVNFSLKEKNTGTAVVGTTSYSGVDATFVPLANLVPGTTYTATVKGGATGVEDLAGNALAADYSWSWTTAVATDPTAPVLDTTAPLVVLVNPVESAPGVAVTTSVNATFNEAMDPLTITTANFKVAGVTGTVSYNAQSKVATFTPNANLAAGTTYTATVTTAAADLAGNTLATEKVWQFTTEAAPVIVPMIALNTVAPFGTFGGTAGMTNMGTLTVINGDIGTIATGTSMVTGFHDTLGDIYTETGSNIGAVNGKIYTCTTSTTGPTSAVVNAPACAAATQARLDAQTAYLALVAKPVGGASPAPGANLAGVTLLPGTYVAPGGSYMIQGGNLTLDAQGDANATWVFQMATTLTVGGPGAAFPQSIILAGGAQGKNVFWQVGSTATINAAGGGTMVGTIIAQDGVVISTAGNVNPVTLNGRALSLGASVTMVNTVINVPAQ